MWKYVAFVALIIFCVPGVFAEDNEPALAEEVIVENGTNETTTVSPPTEPTESTQSPTSTEHNTTEVPSSTTVVPSSTTVAPPTTPLPSPKVGKFSIQYQGENKTCLQINMALRVKITDLNIEYNFPAENVSTEGSDCHASNSTSEILQLNDLINKHSLTFIFVREKNMFFAQNITFTYSDTEVLHTSGEYFKASVSKSYSCTSEPEITIGNSTLTFSSVRVQAFGADSFGLAEECRADDKVGDIVPIAVGCALAALVIIVLIAYLVGRRQSRQRGYQSV